MVQTQEEMIELETIKQDNKIELLKAQDAMAKEEHNRKMKRLDMLFKIAEAGGVKNGV